MLEIVTSFQMKRIIIIALILTVVAIGVLVSIPLSARANCFRNGTVPSSIAQATVKIRKWVYHAGKEEWFAMGVSKQELLSSINAVEVNGPAMTFEHHSTRYVTFRLSNCPAITEPITVGVHCGDTPNLGWVAKSCLGQKE
jgi:hypothetical protein